MTVMIVDDSAEMRRLLSDMVSPLSKAVVECADGQECLERFEACQPEWTIMDVQMPRLDGLEAARAVHERWPAAKVVMVTHFFSPAIEAAADAAGAVGCVSKDDLYRLLEFMGTLPVDPATPAPQAPAR
ncbi:MAG TPA: response regulator [Candidatus Limnocylindria bacterium]|jgi:CheY-like chemotaxis protein|nr:response regulator [Candidatus Limnocylindria bacterium]